MYQVPLSREQDDVGTYPQVESLLAYHQYQSPLSSLTFFIFINIIDVSSASHLSRTVSKLAINC